MGRISLFVLDDVSTDLNETDPNLLSDNVNVKKWSPISDVVFNTGQHPVNPEHLAAGVTGLRILLIDEDGNWDISDNDFVVNRVTAGGYRADAITSPSDGEIWTEGTTETLVWDTVLIDSGWISIFVLSDDSMGLDYSNPNLVDAVNSKMWEHRRSEDTAVGSLDLDPSDLGGNGSASRILIIDDSGNWDIVDSDFTISP
ncbi:MAG: hypothetical protein GY866_30140 [Proteobacteria bacterium]|nr:hypothetical protein [Pseudomonadota bacterium]